MSLKSRKLLVSSFHLPALLAMSASLGFVQSFDSPSSKCITSPLGKEPPKCKRTEKLNRKAKQARKAKRGY